MWYPPPLSLEILRFFLCNRKFKLSLQSSLLRIENVCSHIRCSNFIEFALLFDFYFYWVCNDILCSIRLNEFSNLWKKYKILFTENHGDCNVVINWWRLHGEVNCHDNVAWAVSTCATVERMTNIGKSLLLRKIIKRNVHNIICITENNDSNDST